MYCFVVVSYRPDDAQKQEAVPPEADLNTTQGFRVRSNGVFYLV